MTTHLAQLSMQVLEDVPERLVFSLPAQRRPIKVLLLALGLIFWAVVFLGTARAIFTSASSSIATSILLLIWLLGWVLVGAIALYLLLWLRRGRELITLTAENLTIRRDLFGYGRDQTYKLRHLKQLQVTDDRCSLYQAITSLRPFGLAGGRLQFDYIGLSVQFGAGISSAEAQAVCERLQRRLPVVD